MWRTILTMEGEGGTILTMGRRVEGSQEVISADYFPFEQHRLIKVGISYNIYMLFSTLILNEGGSVTMKFVFVAVFG